METLRTFTRLLPAGEFRVGVLLDMLRQRWLIRLRWIIAVATIVVLLWERLQFPRFQRPAAIFFCVGALALFNLLWSLISRALLERLGDPSGLSPAELRRLTAFANAQMLVDLLLLTAILRYSGGIESPMAVF